MHVRTFASTLALVTLGAILSGCAGADGGDAGEEGPSQAVRVTVAEGSWMMYSEPGFQPGFCDRGVSLKLSASGTATLEDRMAPTSTCELAVMPNARSYKLEAAAASCGSRAYTAERRDAEGLHRLSITDHRTRMCEDLQVAALIVKEELVPAGGGASASATYYSWFEPPQQTLEGVLTATAGIGGESTGTSLRMNAGMMELVLDEGERNQFVDGRMARVKGTKTTLQGVETGNREALDVREMLVCPNSSAVINCMPTTTGRLSNLCGQDNRSWVEARCGGVSFLD